MTAHLDLIPPAPENQAECAGMSPDLFEVEGATAYDLRTLAGVCNRCPLRDGWCLKVATISPPVGMVQAGLVWVRSWRSNGRQRRGERGIAIETYIARHFRRNAVIDGDAPAGTCGEYRSAVGKLSCILEANHDGVHMAYDARKRARVWGESADEVAS